MKYEIEKIKKRIQEKDINIYSAFDIAHYSFPSKIFL